MEDFLAKNYDDYDKDIHIESNPITWIDIDSWDRKRLFYNYLGTEFPYIIMTANIDVTKPLEFARENKISFNNVMSFLCAKVVDSIKNYHYRFYQGKPFYIQNNRPIVNHLKPGESDFVMAAGPWPCDDIIFFSKELHERQMKATPDDMSNLVRHKLDIINYTSIPWVQYTGFIRTIIENGVDNAPKISFGKYFKDSTDPKKTWMPVSNQTHHGLMDGYHVGLFYQRLQEECDGVGGTLPY